MGFFKRVADWFNWLYTDDNPVNTLAFLDEDVSERPAKPVPPSSFVRPPEDLKPPKDDELPADELTGLKPIWDCKPCAFAELFTCSNGQTVRVCTCNEKMREWGLTDDDLAVKQQCIRDAGILCYGFQKGTNGEAICNGR